MKARAGWSRIGRSGRRLVAVLSAVVVGGLISARLEAQVGAARGIRGEICAWSDHEEYLRWLQG